jgi:hypothetical protein
VGGNENGQLGHGSVEARLVPAPVEGLEGVRAIAAAADHTLAVTQSGDLFFWGRALLLDQTEGPEGPEVWYGPALFRPTIVEGFGEVRVRRVCVCADADADEGSVFAIGEDGELFSWGTGRDGQLGHGDGRNQPSPKRVEALRGVRVSGVTNGSWRALALTEDGQVHAWGGDEGQAEWGIRPVERELLPKPVEALRGVRVGGIAAALGCSYAVADTGQVWSWERRRVTPISTDHGEQADSVLLEPIEAMWGFKVDAVITGDFHTLALADDGSVYAWGDMDAAISGALGLRPLVTQAERTDPTPRRIPTLRVGCGD